MQKMGEMDLIAKRRGLLLLCPCFTQLGAPGRRC